MKVAIKKQFLFIWLTVFSFHLIFSQIDLLNIGSPISTSLTIVPIVNPMGTAVIRTVIAAVAMGTLAYKKLRIWLAKQHNLNALGQKKTRNSQSQHTDTQKLTDKTNNSQPEDPKKNSDDDDDNEKDTIKISENDAKHIFRNSEGHLPNTSENRSALKNLCADKKNYLGSDLYGTKWFAKILPNGKQLWAGMRNNKIRYGGLNDFPRIYNSTTGLSRMIR